MSWDGTDRGLCAKVKTMSLRKTRLVRAEPKRVEVPCPLKCGKNIRASDYYYHAQGRRWQHATIRRAIRNRLGAHFFLDHPMLTVRERSLLCDQVTDG